jgi:hypothetical protein
MFFESLNGSKIWRGIDELTSLRPSQALMTLVAMSTSFDHLNGSKF